MQGHLGLRSIDGLAASAIEEAEGDPAPVGLAVFTPDIVVVMSAALELAWDAARAANPACATDQFATETRRQLALAIIEAARRGTRDRVRLSESALRSFFPLGIEGAAD